MKNLITCWPILLLTFGALVGWLIAFMKGAHRLDAEEIAQNRMDDDGGKPLPSDPINLGRWPLKTKE